MITFKCKMCGGDLKIQEGEAVCECEFCGTRQTIPQADSEKKTNLFNRANRLRMSSEFDKAAAVYASVTAEFPEEAEAYWGLCLCKYGIEYVDDPATGRKIPTCHRTLPESIMEDGDFEQACENADPVARRLYREEAKEIDRLQRRILAIVANEQPYDAFICYKETDEDGERTEDSVLAQDIFDALTGKGLKVFFSRITLEDKLGQEYEPYIYAALHSAKVLLAVGTKFEYYDAVWVKNEWARFLDMMKTDREKALIPCYKGLDAYDMPKEFRNLQGQDMGKLGWLQDLTRGVIKLCGKDPSAVFARQAVRTSDSSVDGLVRRAFVFLEDHKWDRAREYAEKVLDRDVENGQAYLIELLASKEAESEAELENMTEPLDGDENYGKILRFGDEELVRRMEGYNLAIKARAEGLLEQEHRTDGDRIPDETEEMDIPEAEEEEAVPEEEETEEEKEEKLRKIREEEERKQRRDNAKQRIEKLRWKNNELKENYALFPRELSNAEEDVRVARLRVEALQGQIDFRKKDIEKIWDVFVGRKMKEDVEKEIVFLQGELDQANEKLRQEKEKLDRLKIRGSDPQEKPLGYNELNYRYALICCEEQDYEDAYLYFSRIRGYADVEKRLANDPELRPWTSKDEA